MNIKVLSIEEWNSHPAVEVSFPENKKDALMYRLEAGWYHGGLCLPILSDGSVCIDAFRWLHRTKYIQFLETIKSIESQKAKDYLNTCNKAGDFDELDVYFSKSELPYWV